MNNINLNELIDRHNALLLYFFHNQCAPCVSLRPKVMELVENEFPNIQLILIDGVANPKLSAGLGVYAYPTLLLYIRGNESGRWSKYVSIAQLREHISRPYGLLFDQI